MRVPLAALAFAIIAAPALAAPDALADVRIFEFLYDPSPQFVDVGDEVRFTNDDADPHTATCTTAGCAFDTGTLSQSEAGTVVVPAAGTVVYYCVIHPDMLGKLNVGTRDGADADLAVLELGAYRASLLGLAPNPTAAAVTALVANEGPLPTPATLVRFLYVDALGDTKGIGDASVPPLAPGEAFLAQRSWTAAPPAGEWLVTAKLDVFNAVVESSETNNVRSEPLSPGLV